MAKKSDDAAQDRRRTHEMELEEIGPGELAKVWVRLSAEAIEKLEEMEAAMGGSQCRTTLLEEMIRDTYAEDHILDRVRRG